MSSFQNNYDLFFRVLDVENDTLASIYKSLGRCIAIVDDKVQGIYGQDLETYFKHHDIEYKPLVYKGNEVDKEIGSVENILVSFCLCSVFPTHYVPETFIMWS